MAAEILEIHLWKVPCPPLDAHRSDQCEEDDRSVPQDVAVDHRVGPYGEAVELGFRHAGDGLAYDHGGRDSRKDAGVVGLVARKRR